ncbi:acetyltransferase [Salinibacterium sp. M195]|uniref:acetyltransferase n=1 Tax=Salinibacterium sp. M195 TaxID=2583374 RepID=UPI00210767C1|nr:acetyltransferase [Salinibacterium sp. M195]
MTVPLVVIGAGGFGREALDVAEAINAASDAPLFDILGVIDDAPDSENLRLLSNRGIRYLGTQESWPSAEPTAQFVVGIGSPLVRQRIAQKFGDLGRVPATLIHPSANIGSEVVVSGGLVICAGVAVSTNVSFGAHVHVNANATIGHDTVLGDYVSVNPGAVISGNVVIEARTLIGAGAVLLQGLRVGEESTVGAAACVVRNVEQGRTVKGIPAR